MIGALKSNSLSLLGDAIAMSVDVFSYITNLFAESSKDYHYQSNSRSSEFKRIATEIAIPSFSVVCLLGVTGYISYDAILVLQHPPEVDDVPIAYLYGFATLNLLIDVMCAMLFYRRGREVFEEPRTMLNIPTISLETSVDSEEEFGHLDEDLDGGYSYSSTGSVISNSSSSSSRNDETFVPAATKKNLNMMSAWTHVGGDTIRTISVLAAATVSMFSGIDGDICDAWAAIIVSLTILVMTVPLMIDIYTVACSFDDEQQGHSRGYSPIKTKEPIL